MPYMYSEMQNKLSKTRDSPLESMGQIISSRCPFLIRSIFDLSGIYPFLVRQCPLVYRSLSFTCPVRMRYSCVLCAP